MAGEIAYPTLSRSPSRLTWGLMDNTEVHESPFNRTIQTAYRFGTHWMAKVSYDELSLEDSSLLEAFFGKLKGRSGRVYLPDFSRLSPRGNPLGTPVTSQIHTAGFTQLHTSGWTLSTTGLLLPADRVQIGDNYFMVLDQVDSDASGNAVVDIDPPIAVDVAAAVALTLTSPKCRMMLSKNGIQWSIRNPVLTSIVFSMEEAHA